MRTETVAQSSTLAAVAGPAGAAPYVSLPRPIILKLRDTLVGQSRVTGGECHTAIKFADAQRVPRPDALVARHTTWPSSMSARWARRGWLSPAP